MQVELIPTLALVRELYRAPRDAARFRRYLDALRCDEGDLALPITAMNPMAKAHVLDFVETLLAMDAEAIAAASLTEASLGVTSASGKLRVAVVVADDVAGGWTNRYTTDAAHRFESGPFLRRDLGVTLLFASEPPTPTRVGEESRCTVFRAAFQRAHGPPRTLRERLEQERFVLRSAGASFPVASDGDLARAREVMAPHLDATDAPTLIGCLYGDDAARELGYEPLGVAPWSGMAAARSFVRTSPGRS